jgi:hypothetical protein
VESCPYRRDKIVVTTAFELARSWAAPGGAAFVIQHRLTLYRLHFIDQSTGTIGHTYEFHAEDDAAAIRFAEVWSEHAPMELHSRKCRVMRWTRPSNEN